MNSAIYESTKSFWNLPCAHRQWRDTGKCAKVHGYSRSFHFTFGCTHLDDRGWVVDFGGLTDLKAFLEAAFDHTLLLDHEDPLLDQFLDLERAGGCALTLIPGGPSMESTGRWVCDLWDSRIRRLTNDRCWIVKVEVRENDKNSGIYYNPRAGQH